MSDAETTDFLRRLIQDVSSENVDLKCDKAKLEDTIIKLRCRIDYLTEMADQLEIENATLVEMMREGQRLAGFAN
jgi:hypothetical protein